VQKHQNKVQQELENAAMGKLAALMPQMGDMVRALALAKASWDVDAALGMLRQFQVANLDHLNALSKVSHDNCSFSKVSPKHKAGMQQ
jgi:hypothetical protein